MGKIGRIAADLGPNAVARCKGISIKALRHYEKIGLLQPRRTTRGWRLYDREDLTRVDEILAFRAMGFELAQIADLLGATPDVIAAALAAQAQHLTAREQQVRAALAAIREAQDRLESDPAPQPKASTLAA